MNKLYESYKGKKIELLSINCGEEKSTIQETINTKGIKYNTLLDPDGKTATAYKVQYIPLNILLDINGKIIYRDNSVPSEDLIKKASE